MSKASPWPPPEQIVDPVRGQLRADALRVALDSDDYVTLREPKLVARIVVEFLSETAS